ncbi:hypothetical protein [Frigoriglobus tundricola]|uniref:hypothetical protein n=1 Tax=Frigoriglobus tundricola TaxID=2774151 RepID=UPI00148ED0A1|nr:hypothetical protein [Frigoriglobus tundricola]
MLRIRLDELEDEDLAPIRLDELEVDELTWLDELEEDELTWLDELEEDEPKRLDEIKDDVLPLIGDPLDEGQLQLELDPPAYAVTMTWRVV